MTTSIAFGRADGGMCDGEMCWTGQQPGENRRFEVPLGELVSTCGMEGLMTLALGQVGGCWLLMSNDLPQASSSHPGVAGEEFKMARRQGDIPYVPAASQALSRDSVVVPVLLCLSRASNI